MHRLIAALVLLLGGAGSAAAAVTIDGTVFADLDGDGVLSAGDQPLPGVAVGFETVLFAVTDARGHYVLSAPGDGQVWVRIPDGYLPSPVWQNVTLAAGSRTVDLPLRRSPATGPVRFVLAADTHIGSGVPLADVRVAFRQATSQTPPPHFFVIAGDLTSGSIPSEFRDLHTLLGEIDLPFVPVIGNHDVGENEVPYRREMGPPQYSFDQGGVHFIVLDYAFLGAYLSAAVDFIRRDVALSPPGTPVVAFTHAPINDSAAAMLADAGIDTLFTGHWHSNRFIEHGPMLEVTTQTLDFGGLDLTPAGYRVVSWTGDRLAFTEHTIVDRPVLRAIYPRADACVPAGDVDVLVAAEDGTQTGEVTLSLDGQPAVSMAPQGGWSRAVTVKASAGQHRLDVAAKYADAPLAVQFCATASARPAPATGEWTQLQGGPEHHGVIARPLVPPLSTVWARPVGGHLLGGSVVVSGGRLFAPVVDLNDNTRGGIVALDAATGAELWEKRTGYAVRNAPAVYQGLVIYGSSAGLVTAADVATGATVWTYDVGAGLSKNVTWLYAAPTIADGVVYVGVQARFAAIDAATGRELWSRDPSPSGYWLSSYSSAGVSGGVVVAAFARGYDGVVAWDALDGHELWRVPAPLATAVNSAIAMDGDTVYFGNSETAVHAVDLTSPMGPKWSLWSRKLDADANNWSYGIMSSVALAGGKLLVPTLYGSLVALDQASGAELWRHGVDATVFRPVHYQGAGSEAFVAAPVVTGDVVWAGGADGVLYAIALESGKKLWAVDLGAPITSAPVPAGDLLYVGTFDGTVQALAHDDGAVCGGDQTPCPGAEPKPDGCTIGSAGAGAARGRWALYLAMILGARRLRRAVRRPRLTASR